MLSTGGENSISVKVISIDDGAFAPSPRNPSSFMSSSEQSRNKALIQNFGMRRWGRKRVSLNKNIFTLAYSFIYRNNMIHKPME